MSATLDQTSFAHHVLQKYLQQFHWQFLQSIINFEIIHWNFFTLKSSTLCAVLIDANLTVTVDMHEQSLYLPWYHAFTSVLELPEVTTVHIWTLMTISPTQTSNYVEIIQRTLFCSPTLEIEARNT